MIESAVDLWAAAELLLSAFAIGFAIGFVGRHVLGWFA